MLQDLLVSLQVGHYSPHKSPFFLAVELGLDRIINYMHSLHGVVVEAPGPQGITPLCVAALLAHTGVMESLLNMRADPFAVNARQRRSALHYVSMKGSLKAFQTLLRALSRSLLLQAADAEASCPTTVQVDGYTRSSSSEHSWKEDGVRARICRAMCRALAFCVLSTRLLWAWGSFGKQIFFFVKDRP